MSAPVPEYLLLQFMKIIDSFQAGFILAISSSSQILSSTAEGNLKYITTSKVSKSLKTGNIDQSVKLKNFNESLITYLTNCTFDQEIYSQFIDMNNPHISKFQCKYDEFIVTSSMKWAQCFLAVWAHI